MAPLAYLNGEILPLADAKVSIVDIGILRGFGIYEGLITHNRKPFRLADHIERFRRSAEKMSIKVPVDDADIESAIRKLVEANVPAEKEGLIRIILTGGPAVGVIDYNPETPTMFILVDEFRPLEEHYLKEGCSVSVVEYHRDLAEIKSTNYIKTVLLQKERKAKGDLELIYTWQGQAYEGGGSNFFLVKNGTLITTKDDIVLGITRKVVLEIAREHFNVEERPITVDEMYGADEMFITGSFKEVVGVVKAGDRTIGNGTVGPATKRIIELFENYAKSY